MKINKVILNCLFLFGFVLSVQSQNDTQLKDSTLIHELIISLFDGMREADSAKVSSAFHKEVKMYTSFTDKNGQLVLKEGTLASFLNAVGTPHDEIWDEKIWGVKISIDGGIAQVWADYAFYISKEFSHCGVDAFHLVKQASGNWKIIHLMDTRRKEGCIQEQ
jgi:hypothetical protein